VPRYPALEIRFAPGPGAGALQDLLYAELDEFEPSAIEDHDTSWRVFFTTSSRRDEAGAALRSAFGGHVLDLARIDVDDEDWARRSQADLKAITVGRIVVAPPWDVPAAPARRSPVLSERSITRVEGPQAACPERGLDHPGRGADHGSGILIVITPSMGFGTGHHATTRLCLDLLQKTDLHGRRVLDVGTGSGVLAIAAAKLGATRVTAIDNDPDAIENARENIRANGVDAQIDLRVADLEELEIAADVLLANLTASALTTHAAALQSCLERSGIAILSGFSPDDAPTIAAAWSAVPISYRATEGDWAALALAPSPNPL
jgi:ribosomal protein L11 methylase PrmA